MNKKIITSVVVISFFLFAILYIFLPWCLLYIGLWLEPDPLEPLYVYKEFPFELIYEINGETKIVRDVLVCEYDGIKINEATGKHREWKSYLLSDNNINKIVLFNPSELEEIYYDPGEACIYMGDCDKIYNNFPNARFSKRNETDSGYMDGIISSDELYNKYKIKLIHWSIASPIDNVFN